MTSYIMAFGMLSIWELLIIITIFGGIGFIIFKYVKIFQQNKNENIRLRLEVGKLADEIEKARKKDIDKKLIDEKE